VGAPARSSGRTPRSLGELLADEEPTLRRHLNLVKEGETMTASAIEHTHSASAARALAAFSDSATRRRRFAGGEGWQVGQVDEFTVELRRQP
jgi:hypothetical protein